MSKLTDDYIISSFLRETKKRSDGSFSNMMVVLKNFFLNVTKPINQITIIDVRDYFVNHLDKRENLKTVSKNVKRFMLIGFFNYVKKLYLVENIEFQNPVPSKAVYQFTQAEDDIKRHSKVKHKILTIDQLDEILFWVEHNRSLRDLIIVILITFSGARISEIRSILKEDVNIEKNFFETGFIKNARKSTLGKKQGLLFFFPDEIKPLLETYMAQLDEDEDWLFPGYLNKHVSPSTADWIYSDAKKNTGIKFSWHYFRKTIITERKKMKCPLDISEMLMGHSPSSVEGESYIKLSVEEKFRYYLEYFPYKDLKFLKK